MLVEVRPIPWLHDKLLLTHVKAITEFGKTLRDRCGNSFHFMREAILALHIRTTFGLLLF